MGLFNKNSTKRKRNENATGIVGAIAAFVAVVSGIRTLKAYMERKKKK